MSSFAQFCLTLYGPMDCYPPGTCVHGVSQVRILEKYSCHFLLQGIFPTKDRTLISYISSIDRQIDSLLLVPLGKIKRHLRKLSNHCSVEARCQVRMTLKKMNGGVQVVGMKASHQQLGRDQVLWPTAL